MSSKTPWKDRKELLKDLSSFIRRNGAFFNQNSKRMSDLFEMSVYNDIIRYYKRKKYRLNIKHKKKGVFRYKLSTAGLYENFSFFEAKRNYGRGKNKEVIEIEIHHNLKVQSAHNDHIYYTADISVCTKGGVTTIKQRSGYRHSFVENDKLVTFFEVKNLNPFPEILFGFSGLVLEVMPGLILKDEEVDDKKRHLSPAIIFSGSGSEHAEMVSSDLRDRYGYNIICGLYWNKGQIYSFKNLIEI